MKMNESHNNSAQALVYKIEFGRLSYYYHSISNASVAYTTTH